MERVHVVHNAVNRRLFAPGNKAQARKRLQINSDLPLIVSVGNLLSVKQHDILISALAKVTIGRAKLAIIGGSMHEPNYPKQLHSLCAQLEISDRVTFVGRIDESEVATWLRAADVFALASRREGCCNAILEALACGLPVVATRVGDNPWFIKEGDNGYMVPVGDSEAMALGISKVLERQDWETDRISADLPVGEWDAVAKQTLGILEECVSQRRSSK